MEPPPTGRLVPLTATLIRSVIRNFATPTPSPPSANSSPPPISPLPFLLGDRPLVPEEDFSLEQLVRGAPMPDLTKELRNTNFPIVHLLLRTGLQELVSTKAPQLQDLSDNAEGWMYLYDGKVENYKDDVIRWRSNKMNLKLVVRNRDDGSYKLKNKKEEGDTVMRRQTWHEEGAPVGRDFEWRKHEYKLVKRVNYYRQMPDGQITLTQAPSLQNYPVLVHYFKKSHTAPAPRAKRARKAAKQDSDHEDADNAENTDTSSVVEEPPVASIDASNMLSDADKYFLGPSNALFPSHIAGPNSEDPFPRVVEVLSHAPDCGLAGSAHIKVLVVIRMPPEVRQPVVYGAYIETPAATTEVTASCLIPGVIEFMMPPQPAAGLARYWVTYKSGNGPTQYSSAIQFAFLPSDEEGRVCLANKAIETDLDMKALLSRFQLTTRDLDVSYCELTRLDFLAGFTQLTTLILDHNKLTAAARLPFMPLLHTLFVNSNLISSAGLGSFVDHLTAATPRLRYLSMINNEACPLGTQPHHYYNYRIYVLSKLPLLTKLDSSNVVDEERKGAAAIREEAPH